MSFRRRIMMAQRSGEPLPYDAEVEYIEATGTQYIQLDFGFDPTDEIVAEFSIDSSMGDDKYMVCPSTWNNSNNRFGMGIASGFLGAAYGNVSTLGGNLSPYTANDGYIHEWTYSNMVFYINDYGISKDYSSASFGSTTTNLKLFYGYNATTKGKIRSYQHKKNGVTVADLIAVRVGTTGYLYDRVSGQFLGNDGTGDFVVGNDLSSRMVEVEYVEPLGNYIQLDFGFDPTDEIYASFFVYKSEGTDKYMVCPRTWNNSNNRFGMGNAAPTSYGVGYGNTSTGGTRLSPVTAPDDALHEWQYKDYEFKITDLSTQPSLNVQSITFGSITTNLRLFYGYMSVSKGRLASYRHLKNGVEVCDLIAVKVGYKGYMYDRTSGTLLQPSAGYLIAGPKK